MDMHVGQELLQNGHSARKFFHVCGEMRKQLIFRCQETDSSKFSEERWSCLNWDFRSRLKYVVTGEKNSHFCGQQLLGSAESNLVIVVISPMEIECASFPECRLAVRL